MSADPCDIDLPPPPTLPSWLGSLCSQIDSYKDFTLPQVFTPRNFPHNAHPGNPLPSKTTKDNKNRSNTSRHTTPDEQANRSSVNQPANKKPTTTTLQNNARYDVFRNNASYDVRNSHDHAGTQKEREYTPATQPWPSLQPVPESPNRVSMSHSLRGRSEEPYFPDPSQPWPSCEVKKPAPQTCKITDSRLTRNFLTSAGSSQNAGYVLRSGSPPPTSDLFGSSPTFSPLLPSVFPPASSQNSGVALSPCESEDLGWKNPGLKLKKLDSRNRGGEKRPDLNVNVPAISYEAVSGNRPAAVGVDSGTLENGGLKASDRSYSLADYSTSAAARFSSTQQPQLGPSSVTPHLGTRCNPYTPAVIDFQGADGSGLKLHSVEEIPKPFCDIFPFPFFNAVQSMAFDKLVYTDSSVVVSAPTGSGKTALFELAILRLLLRANVPVKEVKVVYIGPMKSLCGERVEDWRQKLGPLGLDCVELTGDSNLSDFARVQSAQVICTTPEKWDSVTRRWKDNRHLFQSICLVCIDEVHIVGDGQRGATVEAVITRMKMVHTLAAGPTACPVRFVAVSATLPNTEDIGEWLSSHSSQAAVFKLGEEYRPVRLQRVVLGYPFSEGSSEFRFDLNLTYKLHAVIDNYCHGKPTLVFCSSRKSCQQTAETLVKRRWGQCSFVYPQFRQEISTAASRIQEKRLSELLMNGVGIHHAGLEVQDRKLVEELFRAGKLAVLIATSTLSVGVNLPAHLVVVKATHLYVMGVAKEYSDQQVLQMIGRAGRPQFDTSATVVIMTRIQLKAKYEALVNGTQVIESMLHKNLTEHVNVEVVLNTVTDMADATSWLSHTLLHVRATKNPRHYGLPAGLSTEQVEQKLQEMCMTALNKLNSLHLVSVDPDTAMTAPTERGRLMARYCLEFQTLKQLLDIPPKSSMEHLIGVISNCYEFQDIMLRTSEKKTLNTLNKNNNQETIRFPMKGKIKTRQMKVNCLVQAGLGCLPVQDYSLSQDLLKIFRVGQRITKCLMELEWLGEDYTTLLHAVQLCKSFKAKLWPDSVHVARQLEGIGPTISQALVQSGLTSFQLLESADPQHLELVVNRHPPFGSRVHEAVSHLPRYELVIQQEKRQEAAEAVLVVSVSMLNAEEVRAMATCGLDHQLVFLIGDEDNALVFKWKLSDRMLLSQLWRRKVTVKRALSGSVLHVGLISLDWAGLDIHTEYQPFYTSVFHPHRHLNSVQSSAHTDSGVGQSTNQHGKAGGQAKNNNNSNNNSRAGGGTRGKRTDNAIQQQLDVMHLMLQRFQGPQPIPAPTGYTPIHPKPAGYTLTHPAQREARAVGVASLPGGKEEERKKDGGYGGGQSMLQDKPWEEEPPSPEVNLQTQPWGSLVDDFWDESDFYEPPCKTPKKSDTISANTNAPNPTPTPRKPIPPGDKRIPTPTSFSGTSGLTAAQQQVRGNKPPVFPARHITSSVAASGRTQPPAETSQAGWSGVVGPRSTSFLQNPPEEHTQVTTAGGANYSFQKGQNVWKPNIDLVTTSMNAYSSNRSNPAVSWDSNVPTTITTTSTGNTRGVANHSTAASTYTALNRSRALSKPAEQIGGLLLQSPITTTSAKDRCALIQQNSASRYPPPPPSPQLQTAALGKSPSDGRGAESKASGLCGDRDSLTGLGPSREPVMASSREKPAQPSGKPQAGHTPAGDSKGRVLQKSGFGWEHLQLYQSSRENGENYDPQDSPEGREGEPWSQSLGPHSPGPCQLKEAAAPIMPQGRPPPHTSVQQRPVGVTSPMVSVPQPYMASRPNEDRSCPQSISTANLLQGIF